MKILLLISLAQFGVAIGPAPISPPQSPAPVVTASDRILELPGYQRSELERLGYYLYDRTSDPEPRERNARSEAFVDLGIAQLNGDAIIVEELFAAQARIHNGTPDLRNDVFRSRGATLAALAAQVAANGDIFVSAVSILLHHDILDENNLDENNHRRIGALARWLDEQIERPDPNFQIQLNNTPIGDDEAFLLGVFAGAERTNERYVVTFPENFRRVLEAIASGDTSAEPSYQARAYAVGRIVGTQSRALAPHRGPLYNNDTVILE